MIVTRSQLRKMHQYAVKSCYVRIEKNYQAICMQWLDSVPQVLSVPSVSVQNHRDHRRHSVASCRNIFEIDGNIAEIGFDHVPHFQPPGTAGTPATTNNTIDTVSVNVDASRSLTSHAPNPCGNIAESAEPMEANQSKTDHAGIASPGPARPAAQVPSDPFKRTKNIPFAIAGRRRSIHAQLFENKN